MQTLVDRLQDGYRTMSIMNDLKQDGTSNEFSEASRGKIKEMGNTELYELGETVGTCNCLSQLWRPQPHISLVQFFPWTSLLLPGTTKSIRNRSIALLQHVPCPAQHWLLLQREYQRRRSKFAIWTTTFLVIATARSSDSAVGF